VKPGTKVYLRAPEWSASTTVTLVSLEKTIPMAKGEYTPITIDSEHTVIRLSFDMSTYVIPFAKEPIKITDEDYHVARWIDPDNGPCTKESMVKTPMCTVRRGPLVLARSKRIGAREEDMFCGETVFGKDVECSVVSTRPHDMLALCYVTLTAEGKSRTYAMCDYASAANINTDDPRYFTVFV
jgi:hypothetical protein